MPSINPTSCHSCYTQYQSQSKPHHHPSTALPQLCLLCHSCEITNKILPRGLHEFFPEQEESQYGILSAALLVSRLRLSHSEAGQQILTHLWHQTHNLPTPYPLFSAFYDLFQTSFVEWFVNGLQKFFLSFAPSSDTGKECLVILESAEYDTMSMGLIQYHSLSLLATVVYVFGDERSGAWGHLAMLSFQPQISRKSPLCELATVGSEQFWSIWMFYLFHKLQIPWELLSVAYLQHENCVKKKLQKNANGRELLYAPFFSFLLVLLFFVFVF